AELHLLPQLRLHERPFILDVAFEPHVADAGVLKNIRRHVWGARAVKVFGRRTSNHRCLKKLVDDNALRVTLRSTARASTGSATEPIDAFFADLGRFVYVDHNDFDFWELLREWRNFAKQHPSRNGGRQPDLEPATLRSFSAELPRCIFEPLQDLDAVAIET